MFGNRKGFTLIEFLVAVVIIGILAAIVAIPLMELSPSESQENAKAMLKYIAKQQGQYHCQHGTYADNGVVVPSTEAMSFRDLDVEIQINSLYIFTMQADERSFVCTATANLDDDADIDSMTVSTDGKVLIFKDDLKK